MVYPIQDHEWIKHRNPKRKRGTASLTLRVAILSHRVSISNDDLDRPLGVRAIGSVP